MTRPPAEPHPQEITSPEELRHWFVSRLPMGAELTSLGFFCTSESVGSGAVPDQLSQRASQAQS